MKNVLLYYPFSFSFGGGDHLPIAFISALQGNSRLTVALDDAGRLQRAAETVGIGIYPSLFSVVQVTPPGYSIRRHSFRDSIYRSRRLKKLAAKADICISAANIMDFGRPAHHFMNMLAFGDDAFTAYVMGDGVCERDGLRQKARRFVTDSVLRPILGLRAKRSIIRDPLQRIYPNSLFVEQTMADFYGRFNSSVFYPPTLFEASGGEDVERDPLKVVYIGRIIPEKRVEYLAGVVEKARAATGLDITFHVAGRLDQAPAYGRMLEEMAAERPWLHFTGPLYGDAKARFLLSGTYALHAERMEAFGISVAEYLKAGAITIVPNQGGSCEVVGNEQLTFSTADEASRILARLVTDAGFREKLRKLCWKRAQFFSRDAYFERQRLLLEQIGAL